MKRYFCVLVLVLMCLLALAGCQCKHEWTDANCTDAQVCELCGVTQGSPLGHSWKAATCNAPKTCETCGKTEGKALTHTWAEATCAAPKTCSSCGATEGEALPHTWTDADCENAKTCSVCKATEGSPLGHTWNAATCETAKSCQVCAKVEGEALGHTWTAATCETPKTCETCKLTEGDALGHKWLEATTEAPKTCSVCAKTEGSAIKTDSRFKTDACKHLFGTWRCSTITSAEDLGMTGFDGTAVEYITITFKNNGTMVVATEIADIDDLRALMQAFMEQSLYDQFAAEGMSRDEANAAMMLAYGMTIEQYAKEFANALNENELNSSNNLVYYVKGDQIYGGTNWDDELLPMSYSLKNGKLILTDEDSGKVLEFTRV